MASPCAWSWNGPSGNKGRVKACERCQTQVYDFSGMELPEAEALIYKQESKKRFTLFKRADGKFMTVDCPVQVQRKRNLVLLCVVGALVMISVVALMILMPPAKPPVAKTQEPAPAAVQTKNSASTNQSPTTSSDFFPAVVGDPTPRLTSTPGNSESKYYPHQQKRLTRLRRQRLLLPATKIASIGTATSDHQLNGGK